MEPFAFDAAVYKVQTLVDGGLRITLDLPETEIEAAIRLIECKRTETPLRVACAGLSDGATENRD